VRQQKRRERKVIFFISWKFYDVVFLKGGIVQKSAEPAVDTDF